MELRTAWRADSSSKRLLLAERAVILAAFDDEGLLRQK
jgi:hypothetical protein